MTTETTTTTTTESPELTKLKQDFAQVCTALGNASFQVETLKQEQAAINAKYRELVLAQETKTEAPAVTN